MRPPSFRVRTLMGMVVVAAVLVWAAIMGSRSYDDHGRARMYDEQARGWREIAARKRWDSKFASECAGYFEGLTRKYHRAMWRPWLRVEPDPWAPGAEVAYRQAIEAGDRVEVIPVTIPPMPRQDRPEIEAAHQKAPMKKEK